MPQIRVKGSPADAALAAFDRGNTAFDLADWTTAESAYRESLSHRPDYALARYNYALVLLATKRPIEAESELRAVLAMEPDFAVARVSLGTALNLQRRFAEADEQFRTASAAGCTTPELNLNWSSSLTELGRFSEAAALLQPLTPLPDFRADALTQLALVRFLEGRLEEAIALYRTLLQLGVRSPETHCNLAVALLTAGRWAEGWAEYEARPEVETQRRSTPRPLWNGEDLTGRTILLSCEQGLGDSIQFLRFAELLADRGATVLLRCPEEAAELLSTHRGIARVVKPPLPDFDYHLPLLSLPRVLGITRDNLPARVPYLCASEERRMFWRSHLPRPGTFRVGLVWRGSDALLRNRWRSIDLQELAPLFGIPGVTFVSLQKGLGLDELTRSGPALGLHDLGPHYHSGNLADTAAIIAELDLVISVDTSVLHISGALARPVWVAVSEPPLDWRWGPRESRTSPWYPTLLLFRQQEFGRWKPVVEALREELLLLVAAR